MSRAERAKEYFMQGYACSQAVALAFVDVCGVNDETLAKMTLPFGGGMGRLREVCGAVSGMLFVAGILYGYDTPDQTAQMAHYARVQELAGKFKETAGSIICREILNNPPSDPKPTPRTEEFYKQRPCVRLVILAAQILDEYIEQNPI